MEMDEGPPTVVILTALDLEYAAVRRHLAEVRPHRHEAGTMFEVGRLPEHGVRIALAVTGAGNTGAAVLTERAISLFHPVALLFAGVAGALKSDLDLGDVAVATKVYAYHGGKDEDDGFRSRPVAWPVSHELLQLAQHIARTASWLRFHDPAASVPRIHFVPIAAGEVVLNSRSTPLARQLHHRFNDAAAIEMESAGVADAGHLNRSLPVLSVRGLSDRADGAKSEADADGWQPVAAANAAAFAIAIAAEFGARFLGVRSGRSAELVWRTLAAPLPVAWRSELIWGSGDFDPPAVEVHLLPIGETPRLEVRRLGRLTGELAALGRDSGLFAADEELRSDCSDQIAWTAGADWKRGPAGVAVQRTGVRSAWIPLPRDLYGAVLDPDDLAGRIADLVRLLAQIPVTEPEHVAVAIGVEPGAGLAEAKVGDLPRSAADASRPVPHIRVRPDDALPFARLSAYAADIGEELAARLMTAFRQRTR
jgi:nucleoside phosphorylase